jgi:hypothetical protein
VAKIFAIDFEKNFDDNENGEMVKKCYHLFFVTFTIEFETHIGGGKKWRKDFFTILAMAKIEKFCTSGEWRSQPHS